LKKDIVEVIEKIEQTTGFFYQQKYQEGYQLLDNTLNSLSVLMDQISVYSSENNEIKIEEQRLNSILSEAMKALEQSDTILLSDILKYELEEILEEYMDGL
jgi:hypothetical protein